MEPQRMTPELRIAIRGYHRAQMQYNRTKSVDDWSRKLDALERITTALRAMFPDNEEARATISRRINKAVAASGDDLAFWRRITRPACPWLPRDTASLDPDTAYRACKNFYGF